MTANDFDMIIGLGLSGSSALRYLHGQQQALRVADSRQSPPGIDALKQEFADVPMHLGSLRQDWIDQAARLVVSPGVSLQTPEIAAAISAGKEVVGDVELFARVADKPVAAITGSNAKSSVTTLLAQAANACGRKALAGGNLAPAALDLLGQGADLYVLELSSFQLETTVSLEPRVACVLNLSPDHLDRHLQMSAYIAAKQRIYHNCELAVWNRDDEATRPPASIGQQLSFGEHPEADYRFDSATGELLAHGEVLLTLNELQQPGQHQALNALAVLAMAEALELPRAPVLEAIRRFNGLPHRCQQVVEAAGVRWFNDSKGTNVGATEAALKSVGASIDGRVLLLAGGQGKGQDFSPLAPLAEQYLGTAILFGEDADALAAAFGKVEHIKVNSLADAVTLAAKLAQAGDAVLLSPACASFDMFASYVERGEAFERLVEEVTHDS